MNFIDATARVAGGKAYLDVEGQSIELPADKAKALIDGGYNGKQVVFGIRPENIIEVKGDQKAPYAFESKVNVYELLGAEVFLYFDLGSSNITARVEPTTKVRPGDTAKYTFDTNKIHVFDKETELTITN
jgi:multiple sugar transport system ATP-binding protein